MVPCKQVLATPIDIATGFGTTSSVDFLVENDAFVYPNPTHSEFILELNYASFMQDDRIDLYSPFGKQLYTTNIKTAQTKIDISAYPEGVYFLVAMVDGLSKTFKVLKIE